MNSKAFLLGSLAALLTFSSCSSDDDNMGFTPQDDIFMQNLNRFGTKSSSVNVNIGSMTGFGLTRSANVEGNRWEYIPEYPTATETDGVMAYIATSPEGVNWPGYTYYYIQHVGGAHNKYSYKDFNGAWHRDIDGTASQETLAIKENSGTWVHVNNFNGGKCNNAATHNCVLMNDGFCDARTLNEYSSSLIGNWRLFYWEGNYYLGFDFSMKKGDGKIDADGVYDDWVVKIIPGKGEKPRKPDGKDDDDPVDPVDPDDNPGKGVPSVEVDIHHQNHHDWNEIKTSVHLRDTVDVRVFIPVDIELQAVADDFDIRTGADYYALANGFTELIPVKYKIAGDEFTVNVQVNHQKNGIEILLEGAECAKALRHARGVYDDGITFEIHSYLNPDVTAAKIWNEILKNVQVPETSLTRWPGNGSCVTRTYGQIHSAFYEEEMIRFNKEPQK